MENRTDKLLREKIEGDFILPSQVHSELGSRVSPEETAYDFPAPEGSANFYLGPIRSGKTYGATVDIMEELSWGHLVYATWPIDVEDFDERTRFINIFMNILFFRSRFYRIPRSENLHFIDAEKGEVDGVPTFDPSSKQAYIEYLNSLNHCSLYIDEAWRVVDSYEPVSAQTVPARNLILVTGHKFRTVNLIAQRPTSVSPWARGNMNRYYLFEKVSTFPWVRFARYEYQHLAGDNIDIEAEPISVKTYWASKKVFDSYNSYFYGTLDRIHALNFEAYDLSFFQRLIALKNWFLKPLRRFRAFQAQTESRGQEAEPPTSPS